VQTREGEEREDRGRFRWLQLQTLIKDCTKERPPLSQDCYRCRLNLLLAMNVILGIAQIGVSGAKLDSPCSKPLASILMICGVVNFVQVITPPGWH